MTQKPRSPWKTRFFLDTEFTSFDDCHLISIGIVGEDGREFYAERDDFEHDRCTDFVKTEVLPQLGQYPGRAMSFPQLREELVAWFDEVPIKPKPVLCYDYRGDFDLLGMALGGALPKGWGQQSTAGRYNELRMIEYVTRHDGKHHALFDARAKAYSLF